MTQTQRGFVLADEEEQAPWFSIRKARKMLVFQKGVTIPCLL